MSHQDPDSQIPGRKPREPRVLTALIRMQEFATIAGVPVDFVLGDHAFRRLMVETNAHGTSHVFNGACVDAEVPETLRLIGPQGAFNVRRATCPKPVNATLVKFAKRKARKA